MIDTERCYGANRHHRNGKANAETKYQRSAERKFLELQTKQQHGDGCWTGNETPGQTEHDNLSGRHMLIGEAAVDIVRMSAFVRINLGAVTHIQSVGFGVIVFMKLQIIVMAVSAMSE